MCVYVCVYTCICPYGINNPLLLSGTQSDPSVPPQKTNFTGDVQFFTDTHHPSSQKEKRGMERNTHIHLHRIEEDKERGKRMGRKWNLEEKDTWRKIEREGWGEWEKIRKTHLAVFNRTHCYLLSHQFNIVHKNCSSVALRSCALGVDT